jgi:hypothetical protein
LFLTAILIAHTFQLLLRHHVHTTTQPWLCCFEAAVINAQANNAQSYFSVYAPSFMFSWAIDWYSNAMAKPSPTTFPYTTFHFQYFGQQMPLSYLAHWKFQDLPYPIFA